MPLNKTVDESLAGAVEHIHASSPLVLSGDHPLLQGNGLVPGSVTFCEYWPLAKQVVLSLQHFLPSWTAWVVSILVAVGNKACPSAE